MTTLELINSEIDFQKLMSMESKLAISDRKVTMEELKKRGDSTSHIKLHISFLESELRFRQTVISRLVAIKESL